MYVKVESYKNFVGMKIQFYLIVGLAVVYETRGQKSILNIIEKCIPNEKNIKLNYVYENISADDKFHLLFTIFHDNQDRFFSNKW